MKLKLKLSFSACLRTLFCYLLLVSTHAFSQSGTTKQVKGIVRDKVGPLPGVSVKLKGTNQGTSTDANGQFSIGIQNGQTLIFTAIGFESKEIAYNGQAQVSTTLTETFANLDEVVVVGYGTTTKKEVTSAITSLKPDDFNKGNIGNPVGLIQGKVAGLNISRPAGGDVNGGYDIQLRGLTTLSGGQGPLFVIDGIIGGDLNSVNNDEIESIDILKDGSAAAIYGTRGTNGVILITTKKGKAGVNSIEYSNYASIQTVAKKLRNLNADEFRQAIATQYPGRSKEFDFGANTDWFDEITQTPVDIYNNVSMTGGTENFNYRAAVNYRDAKGIVRDNNNKRMQSKVSITQKGFNNKLTINYNLSYTDTKRDFTDQQIMQQAFRRNPTEPVYDPANTIAGGYYRNTGPFEYYNPVAMINEEINGGKQQTFTGSAKLTYAILDGFNVSASGSTVRDSYKNAQYQSRYYPIGIGNNGRAYIGTGETNNRLLELSSDYRKKIGKHDIQAVVGYSFQDATDESFTGSNNNFDVDLYTFNNIGAGAALSQGSASLYSHKESNRLIAFFGRVVYNFNEKYLAQISLRHEGSSRFGVNNKWGNFPAASVGWRVNKENFLTNVSWLSDLKLRGGFGVTGNQDIGNYRSLQLLAAGGRILYNGTWINTYPPASNPNPDLRWEKKEELNVGADFGFLKGRVSGSVDYYVRNTKDLLWTYAVPVPPNLYNTSYANVGTIRNSGLEVTLNLIPVKTASFYWNASVLFSRNRNKLVSFSNPDAGYKLNDLKTGYIGSDVQTWTHQIKEGGALGNFVALKFLGIDGGGNPIYQDTDGNGVINENDRQIVGNAYPKFQLSFANTFNYKNFDLSFNFRGSFGNDVLNIHRLYYENFGYLGGKNILLSALDFPNFKGKAEYSSRYVEKASYVKLDNLSLGYNFNINKLIVKKIRIYATGQQLLTFTKYKGVDPEVQLAGLSPGIDAYNYYPRTRTYTLGLNMVF
ncbi:SusC/RagA family TonB-linked outer membrane protein [Pedobacter duraquae]|uniref:TonB-linked SusC/RagA family outer membrane protein n=1 Tax=Pedobacter duraquae TaxID=425511 RepID=A0A4R6IQ71_9SPHI|nr:TonB-dependent receptor [Pedobacter duraquae]TDO24433.1 TonB-linked SusC/RagA family outer membrane protein [Pedobacter duraquae]